MRVLIISHGHPDFNVGGAEIAAYNLFCALKQRPGVEQAIFLARSELSSLPYGSITMRRGGEYLWRQDIGDWFRLRSATFEAICENFREFLLLIKPDVVFVHHFAHIGIESLREIRRTLPKAKIILTLHEYMSICHNKGQMIKAVTNRLCYRESADDCSLCFPDISMEQFWLRRHYIQRHFESIDYFVSPSEFLRQRYIDWGIPEDSITVIENGQPQFDQAPLTRIDGSKRLRVGFFGQVTEFKGVDLLLQAVNMLAPSLRNRLLVEIHAANMDNQTSQLKETIFNLRAPLIADGSVRWVGAYERSEISRRMSKVDWVIVPSIWWENSPMVIQEAFVAGRPVICANIGGMAEKVTDGVNGLHFEARNPVDLAETLQRIVENPALRDELAANIRRPFSYAECADIHMRLVAHLRG